MIKLLLTLLVLAVVFVVYAALLVEHARSVSASQRFSSQRFVFYANANPRFLL